MFAHRRRVGVLAHHSPPPTSRITAPSRAPIPTSLRTQSVGLASASVSSHLSFLTPKPIRSIIPSPLPHAAGRAQRRPGSILNYAIRDTKRYKMLQSKPPLFTDLLSPSAFTHAPSVQHVSPLPSASRLRPSVYLLSIRDIPTTATKCNQMHRSSKSFPLQPLGVSHLATNRRVQPVAFLSNLSPPGAYGGRIGVDSHPQLWFPYPE
jgi:hypothetical protein